MADIQLPHGKRRKPRIEYRAMKLESFIRDVPDFPKPGIIFKDITPLLRDPGAFATAVDLMLEPAQGKKIDMVVGIESRGFIFAAPIAQRLKAGFAPARKLKKLPWETVRATYELEYGTDAIEMHRDAVKKGQKVLLVDDLLATGGTMKACCDLIDKLGGEIVACSFLIELDSLQGRKKLGKRTLHSVIRVP